MLRIPKRNKSSLFILLFATLIGSSCATSSQPDSQDTSQQMEPSQDDELTEDTANAQANGDQVVDNKEKDTATLSPKEENASPPKSVAAPPTPTPTVNPEPNMMGVFVGGKAGLPMDQGLPEEGSKMAYIVQRGDTLSKIAKMVYSNQEKWRELAMASAIKNPNRIYPGDVIYYQLDKVTLAFAKRYESMKREETCVKKGENLAQLSKRIYGTGEQWKFIWRHNDQINDPNKLQEGMTIFYVSLRTIEENSAHYSELKHQEKSDEYTEQYREVNRTLDQFKG